MLLLWLKLVDLILPPLMLNAFICDRNTRVDFILVTLLEPYMSAVESKLNFTLKQVCILLCNYNTLQDEQHNYGYFASSQH